MPTTQTRPQDTWKTGMTILKQRRRITCLEKRSYLGLDSGMQEESWDDELELDTKHDELDPEFGRRDEEG